MAKGSLLAKKRRQDELLSCLRSKSYWTTLELCIRLNTSHRTLMRDLAELKEMGIPIESDRGRGGGIRLDGRWGLGRLQLSSTEVVSLLLALVVAETIGSPILLDNLTSIKNRISAAFPQEQKNKIEQLRSRIQIGGNASLPVLNNYAMPQNDVMPVISQCFIELKKIEIEYMSEKAEITRRFVEPQMLILNWPVWYLLCWDELRNDVRMFRFDRIQTAKAQRDVFSLRKKTLLLHNLESLFNSL